MKVLSFLLVIFVLPALHARPKPAPPPASDKWLKIFEKQIRQNNGQILIDPRLSVAVDEEGSGAQFSNPKNDRQAAYAKAFLKMRSLSSLYLYDTPAGREAYLEVINPDFLKRVSDRLEFADGSKRNNLKDHKFAPEDLPKLMGHIHSNMTFVLNGWPFFTSTFNAFSAEDDTKFYNSDPGKNGLFAFANGHPNGQTVRVNFSEKVAQMSLLTTWLIEGNKELGIPALGLQHPVVKGLLTYHLQAMEHDSLHGLQYFFKPVGYLNRLIEQKQPDVMTAGSADYGLISPELIDQAEGKLMNERDGFYVSGYFRRGREAEIRATADFLEDLRNGKDVLRGVGAAPWSPKIHSYFDKGGLLEWLQTGTNRRDVVDVYMRGDMSNPERNLWYLDDAKVFPDSMRGYMRIQFEPARLAVRLKTLNDKLEKSGALKPAEKKAIQKEYDQIVQGWLATVGASEKEGALKDYVDEFGYLKPILARFATEQARSEKLPLLAKRAERLKAPSCEAVFR